MICNVSEVHTKLALGDKKPSSEMRLSGGVCIQITQAGVLALCMALQEPHPVSDKMLHHIAMWILLYHLSEAAGGIERVCNTVKTTR